MKIPVKKIVLVLFATALIGLGLFEWNALSTDNRLVYRTEKITRGNIAEIITATGTLNPLQLVTVGTQVSGQVSHIYVTVNNPVAAGQLMAEIDPSLLMTQLKQSQSYLETAKINYEQSQRDLDRMRMLLAKDYVAKIDLEHAQQAFSSAKNSFESSKTQVERDQLNLNYTKIYSPIDGVVIAQEAIEGQTVMASFQTPTLFKVAGDLAKMKIDISFSESDIGKVKVGMPIQFTVDAFPDRQFEGKIISINFNPSSSQGVVTYTAVASVDNSNRTLLLGMTAYITITLSEEQNVLRVPAAALRFSPPDRQEDNISRLLHGNTRQPTTVTATNDGQTIYVLRNGNPVKTKVEPGVTDETYVEISGPDSLEGEHVIVGMVLGKR